MHGATGRTAARARRRQPWRASACSAAQGAANHDSLALAVGRGAEWLTTMQNADGSLAVSPRLPEPGWATPYAMLLWRRPGALRRPAGQGGPVASSLPEGMTSGRTQPTGSSSITTPTWWAGRGSRGPIRGSSPRPWPCWPSPREGLGAHPARRGGIEADPRPGPATRRLELREQARSSGKSCGRSRVRRGWHCVALATRRHEVRPRSVDPAIDYLIRTLPEVRAPLSLGWGVLGLRAWNAAPAESDHWLVRSHAAPRGTDAMRPVGWDCSCWPRPSPVPSWWVPRP